MLYIFGGLPGTGKTTLASALAWRNNAVYLRIDTIEQALRETGLTMDGPQGYILAYKIAAENLRLGMSVVADSVNPIEITRAAWREVATGAKVPFVEIEVVCSDREEHRIRVETRQIDIPDLVLPTWHEVVEREYELWEGSPIIIDTAGHSSVESMAQLFSAVESYRARR